MNGLSNTMNSLSVECAPPYENSEAHHEAFAVALRAALDNAEGNVSIVQLVDDTTYPDKSFDFEGYAGWLRKTGFEPDLVVRESQIVAACDEVLAEVDHLKLKPELATALQSKDKYISQLFIATWCLLRLGYLQADAFNSKLRAETLLNILPASFKLGEDDSLDIIRSTQYSEAVNRINYIFIPE